MTFPVVEEVLLTRVVHNTRDGSCMTWYSFIGAKTRKDQVVALTVEICNSFSQLNQKIVFVQALAWEWQRTVGLVKPHTCAAEM